MTNATMDREAAPHGTAGHVHPPYMKVFGLLIGLTLVELGCILIEQAAVAATILVSVAIWKILLITRYFMHLRFDSRILAAIALAPVLFASVMAMGLLLERI